MNDGARPSSTPPAPPLVRRVRAALVAYTCAPGRGSEEEVGWQWTQHTPSWAEAVVFTRASSWDGIPGPETRVEGRRAREVNGRTYVRIDVPLVPRLTGPHRLVRFHSLLWQTAVALHLLRFRRRYDLVHHVTFVAIWMPALAAFLGLPFVWGPLGTNLPLPGWYRPRRAWSRARTRLRTWVTRSSWRFNPLVRWGQLRARRLILVHEALRSCLHPRARPSAIVHPAVGISDEWLAESPVPAARRERRVLFVGRYVESKLPELVLAVGAALVAADSKARLTMVGPGLARSLRASLPPRVEIIDGLPQATVRTLMDSCRALLFPSFEGSGFVVVEALARGLPVVCLEGTGPAAIVGDSNLVRPVRRSAAETADDLAATLRRLLDDEAYWDQASRSALDRARRFTWQRLDTLLDETYRDAVAGSAV